MPEVIHAHEVLKVIQQSDTKLTKDGLAEKVSELFGSEAVFENCEGRQFIYAELVEFLNQKGRISIDEAGITLIEIPDDCH